MATLVEKAWAQLDAEVDQIAAEAAKAPTAESEAHIALLKARARGKAEILFLFMSPHFNSVDEIAVEAARRKQYRDAGAEYTSPGMGTRRTEGL